MLKAELTKFKIKSPKYVIFIVTVIGLFAFLQLFNIFFTPQFYFNLTTSEPRGLYRKESFTGGLKKGELVLIEVPTQAKPYVFGRGWLPPGSLLLKGVGALPGDEYRITDSALFINDEYLGPISQVDRHGKPLPRLRGIFRVPAGYFLPISQQIPNSFDGRYFGAVKVEMIRGKAVPIVTF